MKAPLFPTLAQFSEFHGGRLSWFENLGRFSMRECRDRWSLIRSDVARFDADLGLTRKPILFGTEEVRSSGWTGDEAERC